ncbi:hypothetical protein [Actinacidiphila glaucinigra]|uniref:hypothetical protein n=1 Tax=Actinacidiphila glaucinigra TaxID=235986 RepID=UPI003D91FC8C
MVISFRASGLLRRRANMCREDVSTITKTQIRCFFGSRVDPMPQEAVVDLGLRAQLDIVPQHRERAASSGWFLCTQRPNVVSDTANLPSEWHRLVIVATVVVFSSSLT